MSSHFITNYKKALINVFLLVACAPNLIIYICMIRVGLGYDDFLFKLFGFSGFIFNAIAFTFLFIMNEYNEKEYFEFFNKNTNTNTKINSKSNSDEEIIMDESETTRLIHK